MVGLSTKLCRSLPGRSIFPSIALSVVLLGTTSLAFHATAQQAEPPAPPLTREQQADLHYHATNLRAEAALPEIRTRAARYLIRMRVPQATSVLIEALESGRPELLNTVIEALDAEQALPASMIKPILTTSNGADEDRLRVIGRILSKYGDEAGRATADVALKRDAPLPERIGAIRVLGELSDPSIVKTGVEALITLLDPAREESQEIRDATFASLLQVTGISEFDANATQWRAWWQRTRDLPPDAWLPEQMERVGARAAKLEAEVDTLRAQIDTYHRRLDELLNAMYFKLLAESEETMFTELAKWIRDDFAPVRQNGIARADSRVANGQTLSPDVHEALIERVREDPLPTLRRRAARTLDRQNVDGTAEAVVEALGEDTTIESRRVYLEILERRSIAAAAPQLLALFPNEALEAGVARALATAARGGLLSPEEQDQAREIARAAVAKNPLPETILLLATIGDEHDVDMFVTLLEHEAATVRGAAARSLRITGAGRDALLAHADDPAVYPHALNVLATNDPPTRPTLEAIFNRTPPDANTRGAWISAIERLLDRVAPADFLSIEERIQSGAANGLSAAEIATLSRRLLARATQAPLDAFNGTQRAEVIVKLAQRRADAGDHQGVVGALDLLRAGNGNAAQLPPSLASLAQQLRFEATLHLGQWDNAATIHQEPEAWVESLQRFVDDGAPGAVALATEIERRFPELNGSLRERLDTLLSRIDGNENDGTLPAPGAPSGTVDGSTGS